MATGWIQSNDYYYFFDEKGKMLTGWQQLGSDKYYFLSSGEMVTDWKNIGGAWYYFSGNGAVKYNPVPPELGALNENKTVSPSQRLYDAFLLQDVLMTA